MKCPFWAAFRDHLTSLASGAYCGALAKGFLHIHTRSCNHNSVTVVGVRALCLIKQKSSGGAEEAPLGIPGAKNAWEGVSTVESKTLLLIDIREVA